MKLLMTWWQTDRLAMRLFAHAVGLFFLLALLPRLWLSYQLEVQWQLPVYGMIGDFIVAVFAASCLLTILNWHRVLALLFVLIWVFLCIANNEHLYALDAPLRLENYRFVFDKNFVQGSFFSLITWQIALATLAIAAYLLYRVWRLPAIAPVVSMFALFTMFVSGFLSFYYAQAAADWRETSPLALIFTQQSTKIAGQQSTANADIFFRDEVDTVAASDFSGRPPQPNVLMVVVEGLPGVYLRQVRQQTKIPSSIQMPHLSDIVAESYLVPNFLVHNYGTISGLYNLFCGDYSLASHNETLKPFLLPTLSPELRPHCLPKILQKKGYQTVFMQAADLQYMRKGDVMPIIGFMELFGKEEGDGKAGNFWGADDNTLFLRAIDKIDELRASGKPWFLSLLTVGTHHPFISPPEYRERYGSVKEAAVRYLDDSLASFVAALQQRGVPEDTLIIFTSDESHGVPGHPFGASFGTFAAIAPGVEPQIAPGIYGQIDVRASVLDYLGLLAEAPQRIGRSIFRQYDSPRAIVFGEYTLNNGTVRRCGDEACQQYPIVDEKLFTPAYRTVLSDGSDKDLYHAAFARTSEFYGIRNSGRKNLLLAQDVEWSGVRESIGQDITLPEKTQIEVYLDIESLVTDPQLSPTPKITWVDFEALDGRMQIDGPLLQLPPLLPDSRLVLQYSFYNEHARQGKFLFSAFARENGLNGIKINKIQLWATPVSEKSYRYKINEFDLQFNEEISKDIAFMYPQYGVGSDGPYLRHTQVEEDRYALVPRYQLASTLIFNKKEHWLDLLYLAGDWNYPGSDGVQSDGGAPALAFRLADDIVASKQYEIVVNFSPYLAPPTLSEQKLTFWFNDHKIGTQIFKNGAIQQGLITVPTAQLRPDAINLFKVEVHQPFVPVKYNVSDDRTRRGLTIHSFQLREKK